MEDVGRDDIGVWKTGLCVDVLLTFGFFYMALYEDIH